MRRISASPVKPDRHNPVNWPSLNWLDIVVIAVLAFSTVQSFRKGFSREIVGLAASLFALVLAMWFYGLAGSYVQPYVGSTTTANLIGFALVVIGVLLAASYGMDCQPLYQP